MLPAFAACTHNQHYDLSARRTLDERTSHDFDAVVLQTYVETEQKRQET